MKTTEVVNKIKKHYDFKSDRELAKFLGISSQALSNWKSRNTYNVKRIYKKCKGINAEWLINGKGEMFLKTL